MRGRGGRRAPRGHRAFDDLTRCDHSLDAHRFRESMHYGVSQRFDRHRSGYRHPAQKKILPRNACEGPFCHFWRASGSDLTSGERVKVSRLLCLTCEPFWPEKTVPSELCRRWEHLHPPKRCGIGASEPWSVHVGSFTRSQQPRRNRDVFETCETNGMGVSCRNESDVSCGCAAQPVSVRLE